MKHNVDMRENDKQANRLPREFSKNGNQYRLHKRGERAMIYATIGPDDKPLDFEVFQIRTYPPEIRFGKQYPEREAFPHSNVFGRWAWHCHNLEKALSYFEGLERGEKVGHMGSREVKGGEDQH